jgi:hypothetical protein
MADGLTLDREAMVSMRAPQRVRVDGDASEWENAEAYPIADGRAHVRMQWHAQDLYFLFEVRDEVYRPPAEGEGIWTGDCVELYLNTSLISGPRDYGTTDYQYIFAPNGLGYIHSNNPRFNGKPMPPFSRAAGRQTDSGWVVEIGISGFETWFAPQPGARIAWTCLVSDHGSASYPLIPEFHSDAMTFVRPGWKQIEFRDVAPR